MGWTSWRTAFGRYGWPRPVPESTPDRGPEPSAEGSLSPGLARLRTYVEQFDAFDEAAKAIGVRPGTLRRNLNRDTATHEALDIIEQQLPQEWGRPGPR